MKGSTVRKGTMWSIQILLAMVFISVGMAKLTGVEAMVQMFRQIGLGQWFRYFTGIVELASGLLMFSAVYAPVGATLLVCTMIGAVLTHLFLIGGSAMPAFLLGALSGILLILKRNEMRQLQSEVTNIKFKRSA
jgi:hypothetical protein